MNLWRLERLRLIRTHRWTILVGAYVGFALLGVASARYMNEIMVRFAPDVVMSFPDPRPVDGVIQFLGNVSQLGLLAVVIVAAGALTVDARAEVAAFLRTRVRRARTLLWPRYVVVSILAVVALALGTAATWAATTLLIGGLPIVPLIVGTVFGALYLLFAVAVVAAIAGFTRSAMSTVFLSLLALLLFPAIGLIPPVAPWLPSHLVAAVIAMIEGAPAIDYLRASIVTALAVPALLAVAATRLERREL